MGDFPKSSTHGAGRGGGRRAARRSYSPSLPSTGERHHGAPNCSLWNSTWKLLLPISYCMFTGASSASAELTEKVADYGELVQLAREAATHSRSNLPGRGAARFFCTLARPWMASS
jgi:hypothetical protein